MNHQHVIGVQRVENVAIAAACLIGAIVVGGPWWILFAAFLAFDLSALGYAVNERVGAWGYNVVHSYVGPAVTGLLWLISEVNGDGTDWLGWLAAAWAFHVGVDRALGFGLKLGEFSDTHLGRIGR